MLQINGHQIVHGSITAKGFKTMPGRFTIEGLPDGGFVVSDVPYSNQYATQFKFAATSVDKALEYVREQLTPVKAKAVK